MASTRTTVSELGTAAGLCWEPGAGPWPDSLLELTIPGLDDDEWKPALRDAAAQSGPMRSLLLQALDNGRTFRATVLEGRAPRHVAWSGGGRTTWMSDIPRDLTVDAVYFIQAKYDSTCLLSTAPATLVDDLLRDEGGGTRPSWFAEVAPRELDAYYRAVRRHTNLEGLPRRVEDLDQAQRRQLKSTLRASGEDPTCAATYHELCRAVSEQTVRRWRRHLQAASAAQRTQMLFRMLRIAGGPYWLLGTKGTESLRLAVTDTRSWRERFELRRVEVADAMAGQPQLNWRAEVASAVTGERREVAGYCEIRWAHGKLQGNPECKVHVTTPLAEVPGYRPLDKSLDPLDVT